MGTDHYQRVTVPLGQHVLLWVAASSKGEWLVAAPKLLSTFRLKSRPWVDSGHLLGSDNV